MRTCCARSHTQGERQQQRFVRERHHRAQMTESGGGAKQWSEEQQQLARPNWQALAAPLGSP